MSPIAPAVWAVGGRGAIDLGSSSSCIYASSVVLYCYRYIICIFSVSIHWHVFGDDKSLNFAQKALDQGFSSLPYDRRQKFSSEIDLHDLDEVEKKISAQVEILMKYFTGTIC